MSDLGDSIGMVHRSIISFSRSSRTRSADMYDGLSFVDYTLLSFIDLSVCAHASDLAGEYALDKSTVSRQLAGLEQSGLLRRSPDPTHSRKQQLKLTAKGRRYLATTRASQRRRLEERFEDWPEADVITFGQLFSRFVTGAGETPSGPD